MSAKPLDVGKKVLVALDRGRAIAIAQAQARSAKRAAAIILLHNADVAKGLPAWGRSGRIARRMTDRITESQVRKILRRLSSARELPRHIASHQPIDGGCP